MVGVWDENALTPKWSVVVQLSSCVGGYRVCSTSFQGMHSTRQGGWPARCESFCWGIGGTEESFGELLRCSEIVWRLQSNFNQCGMLRAFPMWKMWSPCSRMTVVSSGCHERVSRAPLIERSLDSVQWQKISHSMLPLETILYIRAGLRTGFRYEGTSIYLYVLFICANSKWMSTLTGRARSWPTGALGILPLRCAYLMRLFWAALIRRGL